MKYISNNITEAVKEIAAKYPNTVFCGSFGLALNNMLHREVMDLDIITEFNHYREGNFFDDDRINNESHSNKFMVGDDTVECFNIELNKVKVDVMYNNNTKPDYTIMGFEGIYINVEEPFSAINTKLKYLTNYKSIKSFVKHLKDLLYLNIPNNRILNAIEDCKIFDNDEL